jgi:hypothetical protein
VLVLNNEDWTTRLQRDQFPPSERVPPRHSAKTLLLVLIIIEEGTRVVSAVYKTTMNRLIAPALATVCGIATGKLPNIGLDLEKITANKSPSTAVTVFQPELQKQAAEREGKNVEEFQQTHGGAMYSFSPSPPPQHH